MHRGEFTEAAKIFIEHSVQSELTWSSKHRQRVGRKVCHLAVQSPAKRQAQISNLQLLPRNNQDVLREKERQLAHIVARTISEACPNLKDSDFLMPVTMSLFSMLNWQNLWFREDGPITRTQYTEFATQLVLAGLDNLDLSAAYLERENK